jgi:protein-S-isoprenylcysteine O-methyltransferase Ste14
MKPFIATFGLLYLGLLLGWRGYSVWKQTGINPLMVKTTDDVGGFVVRTSKRLCVCIVLAGVIYCVAEDSLYPYLFPITPLEGSVPIRWAGYTLCVASLIWVCIAQVQMGSSWRLAIDEQHRTALVKKGLYRFSRNPIFVGMMVSFVGVFLIIPSAVLLALVSALVCLLQVQVRLEEDHLRRLHGVEYDEFQQHVPRWGL